jgi:hypothetical protein
VGKQVLVTQKYGNIMEQDPSWYNTFHDKTKGVGAKFMKTKVKSTKL